MQPIVAVTAATNSRPCYFPRVRDAHHSTTQDLLLWTPWVDFVLPRRDRIQHNSRKLDAPVAPPTHRCFACYLPSLRYRESPEAGPRRPVHDQPRPCRHQCCHRHPRHLWAFHAAWSTVGLLAAACLPHCACCRAGKENQHHPTHAARPARAQWAVVAEQRCDLFPINKKNKWMDGWMAPTTPSCCSLIDHGSRGLSRRKESGMQFALHGLCCTHAICMYVCLSRCLRTVLPAHAANRQHLFYLRTSLTNGESFDCRLYQWEWTQRCTLITKKVVGRRKIS